MNNPPHGFVTDIRKNFNLLTFFSIIFFLSALWWLFMLLILVGGGFQESSLGTNIFMIFLFPIFAGAVISILAIAISFWLKNANVAVYFLTFLFLGLLIPVVAILIVYIGQNIAKKVYLGDKSLIPDMTPAFQKPQPAPVIQSYPEAKVGTIEKLANLQTLLSTGLITEAEYQAKKAEILSKM